MAWRFILLNHFPNYSPLPHQRGFLIRTAVNMSFKIIGIGTTEHDEPPILIFHGLLKSKKNWEGLGKTIHNMTKRTVVVADLRNHGDSPHHGSHTYIDLAEDIMMLYDKLDIERACLIGHHSGGRAVMAVALMAPQKVSGILVVDISPCSSCTQLTEELPIILNAMADISFKGITEIKKAKKHVYKKLRQVIPDDDVMLSAIRANVVVKPGGITWRINLDALRNNIEYITTFPSVLMDSVYSGPALFIGGQLSNFIPADDLPDIRSLFPQVVITYIKGAYHNVQLDNPKTFLEYTIKFIRTNE